MPEDLNNLRVAFLGNQRWPFCTEVEMTAGLRANGIIVDFFQEGDQGAMSKLTDVVAAGDYHLVFWTRTRDLANAVGETAQWKLARAAAKRGTPIVGVHADLWFGLAREHELTEPYFEILDLLCTADGGHNQEFADLGIRHRWLLPAVADEFCYLAEPDHHMSSPLVFTGAWEGGYHREATHRHELVQWLQANNADQCRFYPKRGQHRLHLGELNTLYASCTVVIGDSCNLPGTSKYCSDRLPTALGRGGILVHPLIDGINRTGDPFATEGLFGWEMFDWRELAHTLDMILSWPQDEIAKLRQSNIDFVRERHTWSVRARELIDILRRERLL